MPNPSPPWTRPQRIQLAAIMALAVVLTAARLDEAPIGAFNDDACYIEMARSIAEGRGAVMVMGPDDAVLDPDIFPPGFPALLSPLALLFPTAPAAMKAVPLLATLLLLPLCLALPGPTAGNRQRLMLVALVFLNPWVVGWAGRVLSDLPFTTLSLAALLLCLRIVAGRTPARLDGWPAWALLVLLSAAAVSVRTIGWAAVLAMSALLVSRRQLRAAVGLPIAVALTLLPTWLATPATQGPITGGYAVQFFGHGDTAAWRFALHNLAGYLGELAVLLVPVFGGPVSGVMTRLGLGAVYPALGSATGALLLALVCAAVARRWRSAVDGPAVRLFTFYLLITGTVLANFDGYPSGVQTRLLIPVLPILAWLVLLGLQDRLGPWPAWRTRLVFGVMIGAALAHNGWRVARPLGGTGEAGGRGLVDPSRGADWITANTPADAVILVEEPLARHIHFRRPVVAWDTPQAAAVLADTTSTRPRYLFIGPVLSGQPRRLGARGAALLDSVIHRPSVWTPLFEDDAEAIHIFGRRR